MTEKPLITILLLCYNHENYAAEAIEGVLSQTYSPLEIFIFDDCSTDATAHVIENTLAKHPGRNDVRFIRNDVNQHSNRVVRNGLSLSRGEFIFVSHGDDVMLPDMIYQMANAWLRKNVSLVTANALYIDDDSQSLSRYFRDLDVVADDSFESLVRDGANACCFGPAIGFEREIYEKFDWVPRYLRAYDIIYPFYAYLLKGAVFLNKPLLKYRVHRGNTSLSLRAERTDEFERAKIEERMYLTHLAHATLMEEEIIRLHEAEPQRYSKIAHRILPLIQVQLAEYGKKLVRASRRSGTLATDWR